MHLFRELLDHMTIMTSQLDAMKDQLNDFSYLAVKECLASPTWRYSHHCQHTDLSQVLLSVETHHFEVAGTIMYD